MLLISHYGNAVLLMGLNALLCLSFILWPPHKNTKAKNHLAGRSLMSLVYLFMSLMCLNVCARGTGLLTHVKTQNNLNLRKLRNLCDYVLKIKQKVWRYNKSLFCLSKYSAQILHVKILNILFLFYIIVICICQKEKISHCLRLL